MEVLVVMAIVALLVALLFPVFISAKRQAYRPPCTSQLRQVVMGVLMYHEVEEGYPRSVVLKFLVDQGYVKDKRLLLCPADPLKGIRSVDLNCLGGRARLPESYYTPFHPAGHFFDEILKYDANPGIAVCRAHGRVTHEHAWQDVCEQVPYYFDGSILRARLDGSVRNVPFSLKPDGSVAGAVMTFRFWRLFTDEDIPAFR